MPDLEGTLLDLRRNRWKAHIALFARRHPDESCEAHRELVEAIYRPVPRLSIEGFRRIGKSTLVEEAVTLKGAYREYNNLIFVGPSYSRVCDRISAIKN